MRKFLPFLIIGGVIVLCALYAAGAYNGFVSGKLVVDNSWADVEVQYQRRINLIPNLVNTVKGAADFEQETFTEVTMARSAWRVSEDIGAGREGQIASAQAVEGALGRLLVVFENYPELKATQGFTDLMTQLEGTENRVAIAVRDYNDAVRGYNTRVQRFPGVLFAKLFGFGPEPFFETDAPAAAPAVEF